MNSSTVLRAMRHLAVMLTVLFHASAHAQIDWGEASDLPDADKAAIEKLAGNVYLNPVKVTVVHHFPSSDRSFAISGPVNAFGLRRVWQELIVCRAGEGHCRTADGNDSKEWGIGKSLSLQERWRFSDGDWFVDVELGTGISYAEAEAIVLAIRRNSLQRAPDMEVYRSFDASRITSILTSDPLAREYSVSIGGGGSGQILSVRLQGDAVLLFELGFWTA